MGLAPNSHSGLSDPLDNPLREPDDVYVDNQLEQIRIVYGGKRKWAVDEVDVLGWKTWSYEPTDSDDARLRLDLLSSPNALRPTA